MKIKMYNCAWCKEDRENQPATFSKKQEPLCARCVGKYRYALEVGVAVSKLSDLTKEERRQVTRELNDLENFHVAMSGVNRQELKGIVKATAYFAVIILFIAFVYIFIRLTETYGENNWFIYLIMAGIGFYVVVLSARFSWLFKLWQMLRKMRKGGYKVNG